MAMGNIAERRMQPPQVGVSVVILALGPEDADADAGDAHSGTKLWIPLVRRVRQPYLDCWALPGGGLRADRSLEQCAYRALETTTDLHPDYLEQLYTFGGPGRSRGGLPMISIVYWAMIGHAAAGDFTDGDNVRWFPEDALPRLAFDHRRIIDYALWRMRNKIEYSDIATRLVGETFTLRQLRRVYEAVSGEPIDAANFRRRMLASGQLEDTGDKLREGRHRPAAVYRYTPQRQRHDIPFEPDDGGETDAPDHGERSPLEEAMAVLMPSALP
ncbi:NUDIX hydrolase [Bifidobacterium leontopitheci]|uniref:NUDIX hydrolase n=1 Tax=Bifidobacterium leontopitheci TaxID=2650774 RepID=A0A6I1GI84_9BIFI|nr:NUDIX domain-containing protein [Bifidobacterium leontopitheci]KAB7791363.1 NUDIX hydrolase [Bifidobacterium leontopitheci]